MNRPLGVDDRHIPLGRLARTDQILRTATATLDAGSVAAGTQASWVFTFDPGTCEPGDLALYGGGLTASPFCLLGWSITDTDEVTMLVHNPSGSAADPGSQTVTFAFG